MVVNSAACTLKFTSPLIVWHHKNSHGRGEIDDRKGLQHGWNVENRDRLWMYLWCAVIAPKLMNRYISYHAKAWLQPSPVLPYMERRWKSKKEFVMKAFWTGCLILIVGLGLSDVNKAKNSLLAAVQPPKFVQSTMALVNCESRQKHGAPNSSRPRASRPVKDVHTKLTPNTWNPQ